MKCAAETRLSSREFGEVAAVDGVHQPSRGPWYCEYPAETMHFQHTAVMQELLPDPGADDPAGLWLVWSDDGRRELRWRQPCASRLPSDEDDEGVPCILPAGHGGRCDAQPGNAYEPNPQMQDRINDKIRSMRALETARALNCPAVSIRDGWDADAEADYARWADVDHTTCPPAALCHQAVLLLAAEDQTAFQAFVDRHLPNPTW
ncbi:hypothetical protein ACQEVZ_60745 [Dactylosporangium sp. CA-152071]|uniref:hypothetical protein n=1 Tax=Dactylosporangium sp. CA-152071 TaxID=3239933 RepID=UPI003D94DCD2